MNTPTRTKAAETAFTCAKASSSGLKQALPLLTNQPRRSDRPLIRPTLTVLILAAALMASPVWIGPATAQNPRPVALSFAQAERNAIHLRQGMSVEEVQKLLGTPRRTALKSSRGFASEPSQGTLHWTYAWPGGDSSQASLSVVFAATGAERWYVSSWEWSSY
jgi:hypothetical protein